MRLRHTRITGLFGPLKASDRAQLEQRFQPLLNDASNRPSLVVGLQDTQLSGDIASPVTSEMLALADEAQTSGTVCFDTFYNYFTDEEITYVDIEAKIEKTALPPRRRRDSVSSR